MNAPVNINTREVIDISDMMMVARYVDGVMEAPLWQATSKLALQLVTSGPVSEAFLAHLQTTQLLVATEKGEREAADAALTNSIAAVDAKADDAMAAAAAGTVPVLDGIAAAQTAALAAHTYNNGTLGVGATITGNANGALPSLSFDSVPITVGMRLWLRLEGAKNGIYVVTQVGDASNPFILTRAVDADTAAKLGLCHFTILAGALIGGQHYQCQQKASAITVGTTALTFGPLPGAGIYGPEITAARQGEATLLANLIAMKAATAALSLTVSQIIGSPTTPVTSATTLAAGIYSLDTVVAADSLLTKFSVFTLGADTLYLRREVTVGSDRVLAAPEVAVPVGVGLVTKTLTDFGIFAPRQGEHVSLRVPNAGVVCFTAGPSYSGGHRFLGAAGNPLSIMIAPVQQTTPRLQFNFELASGAPADAYAARWRRAQAETFQDRGTQYIGRIETPVTGSALARKVIVYGYAPLISDAALTRLRLFVLTTGILAIKFFERLAGNKWRQVGPNFPLRVVAGLCDLSTSLPYIPGAKGLYVGWFPESCVIAHGTGTGNHIAEGPVGYDVREFEDATVANTPSCMVGFEFGLGEAARLTKKAASRPTLTIDAADSMSHDTSTGFIAQLRLLRQNQHIISFGMPTATTLQAAARVGSVPSLVTVTGNEIPASGGVTVTLTEHVINQYSILDEYKLTVSICGIKGILARGGVPDGSGAYTFTRFIAGRAIPVPPNTPLVPWRGALHRAGQHVMRTGRNDPLANLMTTSRDAILRTADFHGIDNFLAIGICTKTDATEYKGTAAYDYIVNFNNRMSAELGAHFFDLRRAMIDRGLAVAGLTPTVDDDADMDQDVIPRALISNVPVDPTHFSTNGDIASAYLVNEWLPVCFGA